jgi:hypothetical protein
MVSYHRSMALEKPENASGLSGLLTGVDCAGKRRQTRARVARTA